MKAAGGATLPPVGSRLEVTVGNVAHGGHCVARADGLVLFVRHTIPGERVIAEVTAIGAGGTFVHADAIEVLEPAQTRRPAPCPHSGPGGCGGCDWQHVAPEAQRALKTAVVREAMTRFAKVDLPEDFEVQPAPGDTDGLGWRTRVSFAVADGSAGLREHASNRVVAIDRCLIATDEINALGIPAGDWDGRNRVSAVHSDSGARVARSGRTVRQTVHDRTFEVAADGFWQVHPAAAATLVDAVRAALDPRPGERLLDLYSGVGLFGVSLAGDLAPGGAVTAIEGDRTACDLAARNAEGTAVPVRVIAGDVSKLATPRGQEVRRSLASDLVVLDPPRTGAGRAVVGMVADLRPRAIAYVACDPVALARDTAYFAERGYVLTDLKAWDFFPQTHHMECVARFEVDGQ